MSNSLREARFIPKKVYRKGMTRGFLYSGPSMKSAFQTGELLYVRPDVQDVKPGDVVVFERDGRNIVHRVLSVEKNGYYTRGDDNPFIDPGLVFPDQVIGRVEMGEHLGELNPVRSGRRALLLAELGRSTRGVGRWFRIVFGWPYRLLKSSGIVIKVWKPDISRIQLMSVNGPLIKYIYRGKTVAVWDASCHYFECRRPFDLVIPSPNNE